MNIKTMLKKPLKGIYKSASNNMDMFFNKRNYRGERNIYKEYLKNNPQPALTKNEIKQIDEYWKTYGIKIEDYSCFQLYYGVTDNHDPRFIPQDIYKFIIWPYYDNKEFCLAWKDKNLFEKFCPGVPFPHNYIRCINGRYFDENGIYLPDNAQVISTLQSIKGEVIVKDAWDSGEGRGIKKYVISRREDAEMLLKDWELSNNFLVQELIVQNRVFSQFNESSVNIMRINSWRKENEVFIFSPTLRIGTPGYTTDICYIDGVETAQVCSIQMNGTFGEYITNQFGQSKKTADVVSDPNAVVPRWHEIIEIIKDGHKRLDHFDIIGWDFTVTKDDEIICIEYNIKRPGSVFYQYVNGPFFGEYTEQVLEFLTDKKNQVKYIPKWMRI